jgi:SAM-dependent methyltransferase
MSISEYLCFVLSRRLIKRKAKNGKKTDEHARATDKYEYSAWRDSELRREFSTNFDVSLLKGKDVLDFGCGEGQLSFLCGDYGVRSIAGSELSDELIATARAQAELREVSVKPVFVQASDSGRIDFDDKSFDIILCFDVLEHIIEFVSIISEWQRVLRQGGRVLITWQPWYHPYGNHIRRLVPIPWAHVLFSEAVLIKTCARVYELPEYEPRSGEVDSSGVKLDNPWHHCQGLTSLNKLTIARFEQACRCAMLRITRRKYTGLWQGTPIGAVTQALTLLPVVRDFFSASAVYEISK